MTKPSTSIQADLGDLAIEAAKKYPTTGKLKGSIYGTPEISSILASFESQIMTLNSARPHYTFNSKAFSKHQDEARLDAATRIMEYAQSQLDLYRQELLRKLPKDTAKDVSEMEHPEWYEYADKAKHSDFDVDLACDHLLHEITELIEKGNI